MQSIRQEWEWEWEWVTNAWSRTAFVTPRVRVHRFQVTARILQSTTSWYLTKSHLPSTKPNQRAHSISDSRKSFGRSVDLGVYASNLNRGSTEIAMGERRWLRACSEMMNRWEQGFSFSVAEGTVGFLLPSVRLFITEKSSWKSSRCNMTAAARTLVVFWDICWQYLPLGVFSVIFPLFFFSFLETTFKVDWFDESFYKT